MPNQPTLIPDSPKPRSIKRRNKVAPQPPVPFYDEYVDKILRPRLLELWADNKGPETMADTHRAFKSKYKFSYGPKRIRKVMADCGISLVLRTVATLNNAPPPPPPAQKFFPPPTPAQPARELTPQELFDEPLDELGGPAFNPNATFPR